eukprot:4754708-Heterocapsa_arctica.AAC.1
MIDHTVACSRGIVTATPATHLLSPHEPHAELHLVVELVVVGIRLELLVDVRQVDVDGVTFYAGDVAVDVQEVAILVAAADVDDNDVLGRSSPNMTHKA